MLSGRAPLLKKSARIFLLSLAQVYGVIAHYLNHRDKVDAYLKVGHEETEKLQAEFNTRHRDFLTDLRRRLAASRQAPTAP